MAKTKTRKLVLDAFPESGRRLLAASKALDRGRYAAAVRHLHAAGRVLLAVPVPVALASHLVRLAEVAAAARSPKRSAMYLADLAALREARS